MNIYFSNVLRLKIRVCVFVFPKIIENYKVVLRNKWKEDIPFNTMNKLY
jgi:hypothetical protein